MRKAAQAEALRVGATQAPAQAAYGSGPKVVATADGAHNHIHIFDLPLASSRPHVCPVTLIWRIC